MAGIDHAAEAERLAHQSLDGDYGDEAYRLRLAAVAQVHATLAVAEQLAQLVQFLASADVAVSTTAINVGGQTVASRKP